MRKSALKVAHRADCLEETLRHPVRQFEYQCAISRDECVYCGVCVYVCV